MLNNFNPATEIVLENYINSLDFPKDCPSKQILLCPVGLIGAGKTTVMRPLSKELNLVRISTDYVRLLLRKIGEDENIVPKLGVTLLKKYLVRDIV